MTGSALSTGAGLAVVVNTSAGSGHADDATTDLQAQLPDAGAHSGRRRPADERALDQASRADVIGIIGGDGSINAAAEPRARDASSARGLPRRDTVITSPRDVGIAEAGETVDALQAGHVIGVDVGLIDGKPFLNTASFGSYADFVDTREKMEHKIGKWAAALIATARVLRHAEPSRVELDGRPAGSG